MMATESDMQREFSAVLGLGGPFPSIVDDLVNPQRVKREDDANDDTRAEVLGTLWAMWCRRGPRDNIGAMWAFAAKKVAALRRARSRQLARCVLREEEDPAPRFAAPSPEDLAEAAECHLDDMWRRYLREFLTAKERAALLIRLQCDTDKEAAARLGIQPRTLARRIDMAINQLPPWLPGLSEFEERRKKK